MANKQVVLSAAQSLGIEVDKLLVHGISLASDDSGKWDINVGLNITKPERGSNDSVMLSERHFVTAQISISRAEIAAAAGIAEEAVRENLTLAQTETYVTQIALGKLLPMFGLSA